MPGGIPAPLASHYYSNLDLLKIPQVRNPGTGVVVPSSGPPPVSVSSSSVALSVHPVKSSGGKKRSLEGTGNSKKDHGKGQTKVCPRMDEVVNNHIDDAINSVIMAVQASLPDDDEEEELAKKEKEREREREREREKEKLEEALPKPSNCILASQPPAVLLPSPALDKVPPVNAIPSVVIPSAALVPLTPVPQPVPTKNLTPKKRSMRSRTIDCRSALLAMDETLPVAPLQQCIPLPVNGDASMAKEEIPRLPDIIPAPVPVPVPVPAAVVPQPPILVEGPVMSLREMKPEAIQLATDPTPIPAASPPPVEQQSPESPDPVPRPETPVPAPVPVSVISVAPALPLPPRTTTPPPTTMAETNCSSLMEEHSSNLNNNTSSGFHSLAQSEQPMPTAATTPAEEPPPAKEEEELLPAKKKQRRRRKNELAAIVADQLLESFKIDNARRDNLKKLENLAYEKSEDLLLTGMLLMSSTKRNAALGPSSAAAAKLKKEAEAVAESPANPPGRGRPKRRQSCYYRRGKAGGEGRGGGVAGKATNENISQLKSSLESFSIGIEKQLLAKEAREAKDSQPTSGAGGLSQPPVSSILRPSILSSAVARDHHHQQQQSKQKEQQLEKQDQTAPAATFSRDPRLNKNIHKEQQVEHKQPPREQPAPTTNDNAEEEDNYLTEIAKNVNEKIMSATTNEDFEFAHDEFDGEGDPDQDQDQDKYYRPPTSMSVRSAPNLNDEHSNFGSMCDDNTNTEVMDMDLDDEMSVYTSYSQDLGRGGRGRRRRRRRSVLLTRRPKKRTQRSELDAEKYGCKLCGKSFFTATSLSKHNMTLAHVSKVSAQEYLQSQTAPSSPQDSHHDLDDKRERRENEVASKVQRQEEQPPTAAAPQQMRASVLMVPSQMAHQEREREREREKERERERELQMREEQEMARLQREQDHHHQQLQQQQQQEQVHHLITEASLRLHDNQHSPTAPTASRLNLNPDERLFYECCNILKSAETPRTHPGGGAGPAATSVIVTAGRKQPPPPPASPSPSRSSSLPPPASPSPSLPPPGSPSLSLPPPASPSPSPSPPPLAEARHHAPAPAPVPAPPQPAPAVCHQPVIQQLFRNPPAVTPTTTPT